MPVDRRTISGWIAGVESSRELTVAIRELPGDREADGVAGPAALEHPPAARPVESRLRGERADDNARPAGARRR